ncbi:MAG: hypothetical protein ACXADU_19965 [Promethearchaeota archaeon]|jgi:hypothetical protein
MPYIISKLIYPPHKIEEMVKKVIEITPKYPPDPSLGEVVVSATKTSEDGIVTLTILEVKEGKLQEALNLASRNVSEFRTIEGVRYPLEVWGTTVEAYAAIGMTPPE